MSKKTILLCDDQVRFCEEFKQRHGDYYNVITVTDVRELLSMLDESEKLPDLLLLDLYYPRGDDPTLLKARIAAAEESLKKLDETVSATKVAVLEAWEPHGIDLLKSIRLKYTAHELPIAIFTQKGLLLLDDEQLREVEQQHGHWLLKKRLSALTEEIRIDRIIAYYEPGGGYKPDGRSVLIIHGHDQANTVALGDVLKNRYQINVRILSRLPGAGRTLIEKFEDEASRVSFAVALVCPDDFVVSKTSRYSQARPNVFFEIGWAFGRLGRKRVTLLHKRGTSIPSDLEGVSRCEFKDSIEEVILELERELVAAGVIRKSA